MKETEKTTITIRRCSSHGYTAVLIGDFRITPTKCCGRWDTLVKEWEVSDLEFTMNRCLEDYRRTLNARNQKREITRRKG